MIAALPPEGDNVCSYPAPGDQSSPSGAQRSVIIYVDCAPLGLACFFGVVATYKHFAPLGSPIGLPAVILSPHASTISLVQCTWFEIRLLTKR